MAKYGLFYGSLRQGEYNFNSSGQKYLETFELNGYDLYSLGSYPAIIEGKGKVIGEIHEIDEQTANYIDRMEIGAGYRRVNLMHPKYGYVVYYVFNNDHYIRQRCKKVDSGDWSAYLRSIGR